MSILKRRQDKSNSKRKKGKLLPIYVYAGYIAF